MKSTETASSNERAVICSEIGLLLGRSLSEPNMVVLNDIAGLQAANDQGSPWKFRNGGFLEYPRLIVGSLREAGYIV